MKRFLLFCLFISVSVISQAQLTVTPGTTPANLVNTILGGGVTVSNITFTGVANAKGTFGCAGACNLGMLNGITLSSGLAGGVMAPASNFHSDATNAAGDATLNTVVAPNVTYDASVLEFDFSVASDSVQFHYVFGSEEYNDWVNTAFNDVFGFFISGPGITGQKNLAIVPGTINTPVSINNVNNGGPYGGIATGPCTNCAYFVDNVNGASVYLDAFTTVLTAKSAVQPCETYHIKLAVADVSDHVYNSDVFIEGGSFSSLGQITLFANGIACPNNDTVFGCVGQNVTLSLNPSPNYNWTTGATTQSIVVPVTSTPTAYSGYVFNPTNFCFAFTTQIIVIAVPPTATITPNGSLNLCPGGSVGLVANNGNSYLWSNGATSQMITANAAGTFTVTVTNGPGCSAVSIPVVVTVGNATASITGPSALCNGSAANLSANVGQSYVWSTGALTQNISATSTGTYTVTVTQAGGCTASATTVLSINANPNPVITGTNVVCQGTPTSFNAGPGYSIYQWSNGGNTQSIIPAITGNYTVTVTDVNGCTGTASYSLTINANPTPAITGITAVCQGSPASLNAGAYTSYSWNTGAITQIINPSTSGNFTVTVTDANGCTGSTSQTVNINALPTPVITGVTAVCQGAAANLDAGIGYSTYQWNTGSATQVINPTNSGIFTVTVTDANGCTGTTSINVNVASNPTPVITGVNVICQGTPTLFDAGAGYTVYSWSNGSNTQTISPATSGPYTVTVTNASGCTGTANYNLTVNPLPAPVVTGITSICSGTNSTFDGGSGYSVYQWNNGAPTQTININTSGIFTVTVTDVNGCTGSSSLALTVNALPTPNISGVFSVCDGTAANLDAGNGYTTYQWSSGSNTQVINPVVSGPFTVTVTDMNGCTGSTSVNVAVNVNPTPVVIGVNVICQGTPTSFDGGAGYSIYSWSNGGNTQTINPNTTGIYTVTVTDINGCTGTSSLSLTVNPNPTPVVTGVNSICSGTATVFDAGTGYNSYQWSNGNNSQAINLNASGIFTVTVTDANGCTGTSSLQLTVNALPTPAISGAAAICDGSNSLLNAGSGYATYQWSNGNAVQTYSANTTGVYSVTVTDMNGCTGSASFSLIVNPNPTPVISGQSSICDGFVSNLSTATYSAYQWSNGGNTQAIGATVGGNYTVLVTDANGCTGVSPAFQLTVLTATATITANGPLDFCRGGSVGLSANTGLSYLWSNGSVTQNISWNDNGVFTVTVVNTNGCTATSAPIQVVVHENPVATFTYDSSEICNALRITFINTSTFDNGSTFNWDLGDGKTTTFKDPVHDYKNKGDYKVILTVVTPYGCTDTTSLMVHVDFAPEAVAFFKADPDLQNVFSSTINFTDLSTNAYDWYWDFGDGKYSSVQNPSHQYDWSGTFTVTLTVKNKSNCEAVYQSEVTIAPFWIPNAFTPNGDGKNDVFFDGNYQLDVLNYHMTVFDRWGATIYETDSYSKPWDGIDMKGQPSQADAYIYMIKVTTKSGRSYTFRGTFDLIR